MFEFLCCLAIGIIANSLLSINFSNNIKKKNDKN